MVFEVRTSATRLQLFLVLQLFCIYASFITPRVSNVFQMYIFIHHEW